MEIWAVIFKQPAKRLSLDLMGKLIEGIAVDKKFFFGRMSMEIEVE